MDASQVTEVIDALCEKLGMGLDRASTLLPQIARYARVTNFTIMIISVIFLVIGIILVYIAGDCSREGSKWRRVYGMDFESTFGAIGTFVIIVSLFALILSTVAFVGWCAAPDVKAIMYILKEIR